jgi:NTE family protein
MSLPLRSLLCALALLLALPAAFADGESPAPARPRIGLVLSGGGARGLAHVGVLKVLEEARIPVDAIAGTSMGAIIGGLYASGMPAAQIDTELRRLDWEALFANRVPRELLSQRRKEEDFEVSPALEIGLDPQSGSPMLPLGTVSSRGLELLLRRFTLPVRQAKDFDALPIPFRAIATDMESGAPVVFRDGDLARALRASMSVPAVFAPTEVDGRILGDGGLVDNLPVDVVRAMGVDLVIAVNVGTPLSRRDTLGSVLGLTAQMINILTEQNVQRSIARLDPQRGDLLLQPALGALTSGDFVRAQEIVDVGEREARSQLARLQALSLPETAWQAHVAARSHADPAPGQIAWVRFEGAQLTRPDNVAGRLASQPGQPFSVEAAEKDSRLLASSGDYLHADYHLRREPAGDTLVFAVQEKPWGPNYFRVGLELSSDFTGRGLYAIKLSHNRHWLNRLGGEWRNRLEIGTTPRWSSEWYQPVRDDDGAWGGTPFVSLHADGERRRLDAYAPITAVDPPTEAVPIGRYARTQTQFGLDLGSTWSDRGELRLGLLQLHQDIDVDLVANTALVGRQSSREQVARLAGVIDYLDAASFPRGGWRLRAEAAAGRRWLSGSLVTDPGEETIRRIELDFTRVTSLGPHTLDATLQLRHARQREVQGLGRYTLGGVQRLSGYEQDQLSGNRLAFGRLTYYRRLNQQPVLTRGFFAGATLEAGNAWHDGESAHWGDLRWASSAFLGADTGLGPFYLGVTWAPHLPGMGLYLKLGRP